MLDKEQELAHEQVRQVLAKTFADGAGAMQMRIVAWLMAKGHMAIAPQIMTLSLPEYSAPERVTIRHDDVATQDGGAGG